MSTVDKIKKAALARLDAGEPAEIILQDYADFEDILRPLLADASGRHIDPGTAPKVKIKNKPAQTPILPFLILALVAIVGVLGAAVFLVVPVRTEVVTLPAESACIGIPQPQITSGFALNNRNQQQTVGGSSGDYTTGDVAAVEEAEEVPMGIPDTGGGAGSSPSPLPTAVAFEGRSGAVDIDLPSAPAELTLNTTDSESEFDDASESGRDLAYAPEPAVSRTNISNEPLRAGEIDDNAEWDDYQTYRNQYLETYGTSDVRDVDTTGRQIIRVLDEDGNPVLNACVEIYNGESHITSSLTYATGMTMFFPNLNDSTRYVDTFRVVISKNGVVTETVLDRDVVGSVTTVELPLDQDYERVQLDVMFLLDATGSMSEEIAQLQGNILKISEQIDALPGRIDVRYGLVSYRDRGDQYVTRVYDFVDNVREFQDDLLAVEAAGGGDYPESLNEGLDMALNAVDWRMDDTIRMMFLVADAPPHVDYSNDADYSLLMQDALARGIKIHQIASGGLEPAGEFVMRQIGQFTMGHFLFLTYEDGVVGTPGDERPDLEVGDPEDEQGIGDYSVSQLDELVLRLITDEIESLQAQ